MNTRHLFSRGQEHFAWIMAYAPEGSPNGFTTMHDQFQRLTTIVKLASDGAKAEAAKRFLGFCLTELAQAREAYEMRELDRAEKLMDSARSWFAKASQDRDLGPTFIAGPNGTVEAAGQTEDD